MEANSKTMAENIFDKIQEVQNEQLKQSKVFDVLETLLDRLSSLEKIVNFLPAAKDAKLEEELGAPSKIYTDLVKNKKIVSAKNNEVKKILGTVTRKDTARERLITYYEEELFINTDLFDAYKAKENVRYVGKILMKDLTLLPNIVYNRRKGLSCEDVFLTLCDEYPYLKPHHVSNMITFGNQTRLLTGTNKSISVSGIYHTIRKEAELARALSKEEFAA